MDSSPQNLVASKENHFIISHNFGGQEFTLGLAGRFFGSLSRGCDYSVVFAGSLVGLEGQGGPSRVPGQERLEGLGHWADSSLCHSGSLQ